MNACTTQMNATEILKSAVIAAGGSIGTVRVSSAQARGAAKKYAYWGAVRYALRLDRHGHLTHTAQERASSDRRSIAGAERDAEAIAEAEGRLEYGLIGRVPPSCAARLVRDLGLARECTGRL